MATQRFYAGAAPTTTIQNAGGISASATSITVASATGFPSSSPYYIVLDLGLANEEKCLVTAGAGTTTWTITRAQDNTVGSSHNQNGTVDHVFSAVDATDANTHVAVTTGDDHTQYIKTDGTRAFTGLTQIANTTPGASAIGDAAALGSSAQLARADHKHGRETAAAVIAAAHPTGTMLMYGAAAAPAGWVNCDGASYLRVDGTHDALFAVIGTTYGAADGTHFNVPDLRGRIPVGVGTGTGGGASGTGLPTGGAALTARGRGDWLGEETHALTTGELAAHNHGVTDPNHTHTMNAHGHGTANDSHSHGPPSGGQNFVVQVASSSLGLTAPGDGVATYSSPTASAASGVTVNNQTSTVQAAATGVTTNNTGSGTAHNNVQPMMCVNFVIKL